MFLFIFFFGKLIICQESQVGANNLQQETEKISKQTDI